MWTADEVGREFAGASHALFDRRRLHPLGLEMLLKSFEPLFEKLFEWRFRKRQLHASLSFSHRNARSRMPASRQVYDEPEIKCSEKAVAFLDIVCFAVLNTLRFNPIAVYVMYAIVVQFGNQYR